MPSRDHGCSRFFPGISLAFPVKGIGVGVICGIAIDHPSCDRLDDGIRCGDHCCCRNKGPLLASAFRRNVKVGLKCG